ncbi:MAG: phage tail terminator protein [Phaeobacter italicus]
MMQLDPRIVKDRLVQDVAALRTVGLAADLGRISARSLRYPSAYVILLGEQAGDNRYMGDLVEQDVTARIGVIMAVRDIADTSGARATTSLAPLREAVLLSLCSFVPEISGRAFRFTRGSLQSGIDTHGGLFWQDDYTLRFDRRIQIT